MPDIAGGNRDPLFPAPLDLLNDENLHLEENRWSGDDKRWKAQFLKVFQSRSASNNAMSHKICKVWPVVRVIGWSSVMRVPSGFREILCGKIFPLSTAPFVSAERFV